MEWCLISNPKDNFTFTSQAESNITKIPHKQKS
jgi:hypothetical protein